MPAVATGDEAAEVRRAASWIALLASVAIIVQNVRRGEWLAIALGVAGGVLWSIVSHIRDERAKALGLVEPQ